MKRISSGDSRYSKRITALKRSKTTKPAYAKTPRSFTKIPYGPSRAPFPARYSATLRYAETIDAATSGGFYQHVMSCNGMYDPDITLSGYQPLYFDQLMDIYDHYTVVASEVKFTFISAIANNSYVPVIMTCHIDDNASATTSPFLNKLRPFATTTVVTLNRDTSVIYRKWDASTFFGPNPTANASLQGTASANPAEQSYFYLTIQDPSLGTVQVKILAEITYTAVFEELKTISGS